MHRSLAVRIALAVALAAPALACKEEGPAEKAGRKMDEAVDKLRHGGEGAAEEAGREIDEAVDDVGEALDDAGEEIDELRDKAADAIESD